MRIVRTGVIVGLAGLFAVGAFAAPASAADDKGYDGAKHEKYEKKEQTGQQDRPRQRMDRAALGELLDADQVVRLLGVLHAGEMELAEKALTESDDQQIRDFARDLREEHRDLDQDTVALVRRFDLDGESSALSRRVLRDTNRAMEDLERADRDTFDREFLTAQVRLHEDAIRMIDAQLDQGRLSGDLMQLLEQTRPALQRHLDQARELQSDAEPAISG